jgi:nitroreductase
MTLDTLEAIRTRRVASYYADTPIPEDTLWTILEAARWAPTAANRRIHRFVCINDRTLLRLIKMFTPGMVAGLPAALIVICIDWDAALEAGFTSDLNEPFFDVGSAAENMLLAAHALGLAAGPMSAFSKEALQVLLNLPDRIDPQMLIGLGYPAEMPPYMPRWPKKKVRVEDLVQWGPYPDD